MRNPDRTDKIEGFIPRCPKRTASTTLALGLEQLIEPSKLVGHDIHDAITKLLASVRRREIETQIDVNSLPDITAAAEAA